MSVLAQESRAHGRLLVALRRDPLGRLAASPALGELRANHATASHGPPWLHRVRVCLRSPRLDDVGQELGDF
eukprot:6235066-Alexandrium_andersonii.AAC.1